MRIIALSLGMSVLSGCFVPFVAGAAIGGAIVYDRRDFETMASDQEIFQQANNKINIDNELKNDAHIIVTSFNRSVLIVGQAPTEALRARIQQLVASIPNIKRIYNEVSISGPTSPAVRSSDAWITTKVKSQMLVETKLRSGQMKVVTEDSVVYLMGIVHREQADIAVDIARQVSGVQRVVKIFEYIPD
ncbi:MAG: osmY 2 [Gammaproteobacteria bacterium]|nr:osmY 2 [Gammaproteobacteria bacterium]